MWSVEAGTRGLQKLHFLNRPEQPRQWFDVDMLLVTCLGDIMRIKMTSITLFVACFVGENEQSEGRRPPGFEGVPVALLGAACIAFFKPFCFVGGPKDYVTEVSSYLGNFHWISFQKKVSETNISIFKNLQML